MKWDSKWPYPYGVWLRWFAWFPVVVSQGDYGATWAWLEMVKRRRTAYRNGLYWEYRP